MALFSFDHCFTVDQNHKFHKKLKGLGFTLREGGAEHPGLRFCRFIMFEPKEGQRQYLEFIHTGGGRKPVMNPGLSFRANGRVEKWYKSNRRKFNAGFEHRNYDWKNTKGRRAPGWNFVFFKRLGFRKLIFWLTEYEKRPYKVPRAKKHSNGAQRIVGLEFEVNPVADRFFKKLLGSKLKLGHGSLRFTPSKRVRFSAVVISFKNLPQFMRKYKITETQCRGKPAGLIKNPNGMWDIICVQTNLR